MWLLLSREDDEAVRRLANLNEGSWVPIQLSKDDTLSRCQSDANLQAACHFISHLTVWDVEPVVIHQTSWLESTGVCLPKHQDVCPVMQLWGQNQICSKQYPLD